MTTTPFSSTQSQSAGDTSVSGTSAEGNHEEKLPGSPMWSITVKIVGGGASNGSIISAPSAKPAVSLPNLIESNSSSVHARASRRRGRNDSSDDDFSENIASTDAVISFVEDEDDDDDEDDGDDQSFMEKSEAASNAARASTSALAKVPSPKRPAAVQNVGGETIFTLSVSPHDTISALHDQISLVTGLAPSQQRLIYRGRLIGKYDVGTGAGHDSTDKGPRIGQIPGLADGQTIHLVKRRESNVGGINGSTNRSTTNDGNISSAASTGGLARLVEGGNGGGGILLGGGDEGEGDDGQSQLLAALFGLGNIGDAITAGLDGNTNADDAANRRETTTPRQQRLGAWRSPRMSSRRRRPHYRLTAQDLEVPDPGTMEPVRQGLMTLHTMLPHADLGARTSSATVGSDNEGGVNRDDGGNSTVRPLLRDPLVANRQWYQGQWLDCRDTVNEWLEATVVEVVRPEEISLPDDVAPPVSTNPSSSSAHHQSLRQSSELTNDPPVGANDMEGRRRLLLERIEYDDDDEDEQINGGRAPRPEFRQRSNNRGVQLLLVHYNGWPHRWDEWIRSDSERIRPFRTRTRHPNSSVTACPTPQSIFSDSPRTNILGGDEQDDRAVLLPELGRAMSVVNDLLGQITHGRSGRESDSSDPPLPERPDLPWLQRPGFTLPDDFMSDGDENKYDSDGSDDDDDVSDGEDDDDDLPDLLNDDDVAVTGAPATTLAATTARQTRSAPPQYDRRQLELLAPLLDRLGRTLTDSAPHIAAFAATLPEETMAREDDPVDREVSALAFAEPRTADGSSPANSSASTSGANQPLLPLRTADPDHMDYASGMINTRRGEVRTGPRGRSQQQSDDLANLLGAYLAVASLGGAGVGGGANTGGGGGGGGNNDDDGDPSGLQGLSRLLRERGTGGGNGTGGIDIHIHAVVTAGGGVGAGIGGIGPAFTAMDAGSPPISANRIVVGTGTENSRTPTGRNQLMRERSRGSGSLLVARNSIVSTSARDDEGLFSELYSENPDPLDRLGSPEAVADVVIADDRRGLDTDVDALEESTASADDGPFDVARSIDFRSSSPRVAANNRINFETTSPLRRSRPTTDSNGDHSNSNNSTHSNTSNGSSSRRESGSSSSRGGWTRIFGRRRSRNDGE